MKRIGMVVVVVGSLLVGGLAGWWGRSIPVEQQIGRLVFADVQGGSLLVGGLYGWWGRSIPVEQQIRQLVLLREIEIAGTCSGALDALDEGDTLKVDRLLYNRLESATRRVYLLADDDTPLRPYLRELMGRTATHLEERDSRYAAWAMEVVEESH